MKAEIGNRLRRAYTEGDRVVLEEVRKAVPDMICRLDTLHSIFRQNWLRENKIFGFDVQDIRFGAQRARLLYTEEVLGQYLSGETDSIPELEAPSLYMDCRREDEEKSLHFCTQWWNQIVTVGVL